MFGSDGRTMIWWKANEELNPDCTVLTVKHHGGNVELWGCFSRQGVGNLVSIDGILTSERYKNILKENLCQSTRTIGLGSNFIVQHDNDAKHRTHVVTKWLDEKCVKCLGWPWQSPDLNPTEHLWTELDRRIRKHRLPENEQELRGMLREEWDLIDNDTTKKWVDSIKNHLEKCIQKGEFPSRY